MIFIFRDRTVYANVEKGESCMNAIEFYSKFVGNTKENFSIRGLKGFAELEGKTYLEVYRNHEPAFTELVNKNIIHHIIEDGTGFVTQHEYFRIDSIGYQHRYLEIPEESAKKVGFNRHFWDLKVAVEHENNKQDWMDEVVKLVHIRCPLKVVIGYNYCDQREAPEWNKLAFIAEWMQRVSAFDKNANEEFLIIIGNGAPKDKTHSTYERFDYRGYLYNAAEGKFERI
jgi:hypothetical protein